VAGALADAAEGAVERAVEHGAKDLGRAAAWTWGKIAGAGVGVILDIFTPSSTVKEVVFRSSLADGTRVTYVILDPRH
jgi:hypothetical protein